MRILAAIIAVAALAGTARAEDLPDRRPMLRIEPGMHTAVIRRIGVDAACTLMVTGSDDKTARLWALPEGGRESPKLLRTLRVPSARVTRDVSMLWLCHRTEDGWRQAAGI